MNWWKGAQSGYLYHETGSENLHDIATEGLVPMSYGQSFVGDMGEMLSPDSFGPEELEGTDPAELKQRLYFMDKQPGQSMYAEVLLRFPRESISHQSADVDPFTFDTVPPGAIEINVAGQWLPLQAYVTSR